MGSRGCLHLRGEQNTEGCRGGSGRMCLISLLSGEGWTELGKSL